MTIGAFIATTTQLFRRVGIRTARLDTLVLLSDALAKDKSWLLAHLDDTMPAKALTKLKPQLADRTQRIPLAYIRGTQAFYGREFSVNANVLIPRPETEDLIDLIKKYVHTGRLLDVGTGSGVIAITAKLEVPVLDVAGCDTSQAALQVARTNAQRLGASVHFFESNLLNQARGEFDTIVANVPYVSRSWPVSPETKAEPETALFADDDGLALITKLIDAAPQRLARGGRLILEADPRQHAHIQKLTQAGKMITEQIQRFGICLRKDG